MIYLILIVIAMAAVSYALVKNIIKLNGEIDELNVTIMKEREIAKQKEKINTGDIAADFDMSIDMLQNYATSRSKSVSKSDGER